MSDFIPYGTGEEELQRVKAERDRGLGADDSIESVQLSPAQLVAWLDGEVDS